jgi:hypothetical protein
MTISSPAELAESKILMLDIQTKACVWNDGTIIACSPIVVGEYMEPTRIVLRDLGHTYVTHMQYWPVSLSERVVHSPEGEAKPYPGLVTAHYTSGNYFAKNEANALHRAWDDLYHRYNLLACRVHVGIIDKARLRTEITTLGNQRESTP